MQDEPLLADIDLGLGIDREGEPQRFCEGRLELSYVREARAELSMDSRPGQRGRGRARGSCASAPAAALDRRKQSVLLL